MRPSETKRTGLRQILREVEAPIVYTLTFVAATVGILVYGATKINSGRGGGLFANLRPIFGVPYALLVGGILVTLLAYLRQWKGLAIVGVAYLLYLGLSLAPGHKGPFAWNEYLALSASLACLITACLVHYDLLD